MQDRAGDAWAELLVTHRRRWLDGVLGERLVVDLDRVESRSDAIAQASPDDVLIWTEGVSAESLTEVRDELRAAASRGTAVVIGIPFVDSAVSEAEALRQELGDATLVSQQVAAASLIGPEEASESAVHLLVCANLGASVANGTGTQSDVSAAPLVSGYVAQLERANQALREANVRLARERLGIHDSAAAAVEERRAKLAERIEQLEAALETEKEVALRNHELMLIAKDALMAPRYRAVDKVRDLFFSIPGARAVLESRRRRLATSGEWLGSASDRQDPGTPR